MGLLIQSNFGQLRCPAVNPCNAIVPVFLLYDVNVRVNIDLKELLRGEERKFKAINLLVHTENDI